jgi:hypothetical protein
MLRSCASRRFLARGFCIGDEPLSYLKPLLGDAQVYLSSIERPCGLRDLRDDLLVELSLLSNCDRRCGDSQRASAGFAFGGFRRRKSIRGVL